MKIYVYDSKQDMGPALDVPRSQSYDELTTTLGVLISKDTLLLLGSAAGATQTIAHELTHLVVGQATDNPFQAPLPRWLDEGLAMYNEGSLPDYNQQALAEAIATNSLISVRSLSAYTGDPNQVNLFYGESYSVIDYLLSQYGKDKMVQLLNRVQEGRLPGRCAAEGVRIRPRGTGREVASLGWGPAALLPGAGAQHPYRRRVSAGRTA